jgi:hypothetical protein
MSSISDTPKRGLVSCQGHLAVNWSGVIFNLDLLVMKIIYLPLHRCHSGLQLDL